MSQVDLASLFARPRKIEIGPYERRTAQCGENPARLGRLARDRLAHGGAKLRSLGRILRQAFGERTNEIAIGIPAEHFKTSQAALAEARSIILDGALL
ncbi:hypothetical protein JQ566_06040 [Bradyrhizobium japonicum]|nr:hypothetical protein [Bradyrhizobium japonicum]